MNAGSLAVVAALILQAVVPAYPLTNDGGSHLYNALLTKALLTGDTAWANYVELRPDIVPNWGLALLLAASGGTLVGAKVLVALCLISMFAAVWYCGRCWFPGVSAGPIALIAANSWFLWMGFWGFCLGSSLAFWCLGWVKSHWDDPSSSRGVLLGAWQLIIVLFHPLPALLVMLVVAVHTVVSWAATNDGRSRWPYLGGAAAGLAGVGLLSQGFPNSLRDVFVPGLPQLGLGLATFPSDAFEAVRLPHADAKYSLGVLMLVVAVAILSRDARARGPSTLLLTAGLLLLGRSIVSDAQLGGAFTTARLGFFGFVFLCMWSWPRVPDRVRVAAGGLILASATLGAGLQLVATRRASQVVEEVSRAGHRAGLGRGMTLVRVRGASPKTDSVFSLRRLRLPYLLTHSIDWVAAETRSIHLTNYELLGFNFVNRIQPTALPEKVINALRSLEEPDRTGHAAALSTVMAYLTPDRVALLGDDVALELAWLTAAGFRVVSQGGEPAFVRFLARPGS